MRLICPIISVWGGVEIILEISFSFKEFACAVRQPDPCEIIAQILSKNMICTRSWNNAMPNEDFPHTSYFYFIFSSSYHLRSCKFFSSHLSSSHLTPSPFTYHLRIFFSTIFISSEYWSTFYISSKLFSTYLSCSARQKTATVRKKFLAQRARWAHIFFHIDI